MNISFENIKNPLNNIKNNKKIIKQLGFIESYFEINNFSYTLEYEILKIYDKNNKEINVNGGERNYSERFQLNVKFLAYFFGLAGLR